LKRDEGLEELEEEESDWKMEEWWEHAGGSMRGVGSGSVEL